MAKAAAKRKKAKAVRSRGAKRASSRSLSVRPESKRETLAAGALPDVVAAWFASRGWQPRAHQLRLLEQGRQRRPTLLIAPTGAGKTLAGFLPTLDDLIRRKGKDAKGAGLHTLYISPLKALAVDVARNLTTPVAEMGLEFGIETRSGDTSAAKRQRQRVRPPDILLTTP